jgi:hypothetical protein
VISLQVKVIALLVSIIALSAAFFDYGAHRHSQGVTETTNIYKAALAEQKAAAATTLANETEKTRLLERSLQASTHKQETQDASNQKTVSDLAGQLRRASGIAGRMRDPNAAPGCRLGSSGAPSAAAAAPSGGAADDAEAGGLFSERATELFTRLTRESDEINTAYISCRADAYTVRAAQDSK